MQVRRFITVLNQLIKKDPSVAYATVAVFHSQWKKSDFAVNGISEADIGVEVIEWHNEISEPSNRNVLLIGVDGYRMKFHDGPDSF
jgi:hypothetical protein